MDIYVVYGETGTYENHTDWIVCSFKDEGKAKKHCFQCQVRADELIKEDENLWDIPDGANEYDPDMQVESNFNGFLEVSYGYYKIELRD